jgi:hypothetical protein
MQENLTLLPTIFQESIYKQGCVVPEECRSKTHEVSPLAVIPNERDSGKIHPTLKEMQPPNIRFPVSGDEEGDDEYDCSSCDEPVCGIPRGFHWRLIRTSEFWSSKQLKSNVGDEFQAIKVQCWRGHPFLRELQPTHVQIAVDGRPGDNVRSSTIQDVPRPADLARF